MGGRESRGRPGSHRVAARVRDQTWRSWRSRPRVEGRVMGSIRGQGRPPLRRKSPVMFSSRFVQWNGPGGAVHGGGGGIDNGLDREARDGRDCGEEPPVMYTGCFVQSWRPWRSRPSMSEGERQGRERAGSRDLGRGGSRGSRGQELVTIGVQALAPCWTWEEPTGPAERCEKSQRNHRESGAVLEETAPSGEPQAS